MEISKSYIDKLKDRLFKILPLMEEKNEGITSYIDSLSYEIYGLQYLIDENAQPLIITILSILEHLYDDSLQPEINLRQVKRELFHCLDLIEKHYGDDANELHWEVYKTIRRQRKQYN